MNLSETDKELIAGIVEQKLRHYKLIGEPAVDGVESEYVRCDYSADNHVTEGKAYKVQKVTVNHIYIIDRTGAIVGYPHSYFSSITREEFDRQHSTKKVEKEWKVGEWAWLGKGKYVIGLITEINGIKATADDQNGFIVKELYINEFAKPTKEEIEQHLVKIAKEKYPIGTKVKEVGTDVEYTVTHDGYRYVKSLNDLSFISLEEEWDKGHSNPTIWQNGVWAEPITEQKERWKPICIEEVYWFIAPDLTVLWFEYLGNEMDKSLILVGNCFKTQEEAERAAQAIRETLKNL